jgi:hypothetical protein
MAQKLTTRQEYRRAMSWLRTWTASDASFPGDDMTHRAIALYQASAIGFASR